MWKVSLKSREVAQCPCESEHMMEVVVSIWTCGAKELVEGGEVDDRPPVA